MRPEEKCYYVSSEANVIRLYYINKVTELPETDEDYDEHYEIDATFIFVAYDGGLRWLNEPIDKTSNDLADMQLGRLDCLTLLDSENMRDIIPPIFGDWSYH
jgi:hypothetical protein